MEQMSAVQWTLPQVLTWIIHRDEKEARTARENGISCMDVLDMAIKAANASEAATSARDDLFSKLRHGDISAFGVIPNDAGPACIPNIAWDEIETLHIFPDKNIPANDVSCQKMNNGRFEAEIVFKNVTLNKEDVLALWPPFGAKTIYHTGAAGRPSPIQFVENEWRLRRDAGEALARLCDEAQHLHKWCKDKHREIATPGIRTIENKIRGEFNHWKKPSGPHN